MGDVAVSQHTVLYQVLSLILTLTRVGGKFAPAHVDNEFIERTVEARNADSTIETKGFGIMWGCGVTGTAMGNLRGQEVRGINAGRWV